MTNEYAIVKFTVDLFAPGAVITATLAQWIASHGGFHSRRCVWPNVPMSQLLEPGPDGATVREDFFHIRANPIMDYYDGVTDGLIDRLLARQPLHEVFDMPRIASHALIVAQPYQAGLTRAGWIDLYIVEDGAVRFLSPLDITEIAGWITEAPTW